MAIGCEVTALETVPEYVIDVPGCRIIVADYDKLPGNLGRFDMAFIDGPGAYEFEKKGMKPDRSFSAYHAKRHTDLVYMHDGGMGQEEVFNDPLWEKIGGNDTDLIYRKKQWDTLGLWQQISLIGLRWRRW